MSLRIAWLTLAGALAATVGCGGIPDGSDAASDTIPVDASTSDVQQPSANCAQTGTGQITVMLQIEPGGNVHPSDVWIAVMCVENGQENAVRVNYADPAGMPMTFGALAAGTYVVRAVSLAVQGVASSQLVLQRGGIDVTSLTLHRGAPPLASLSIDVGGTADAGAQDAGPVDAGSSSDASVPADAGGDSGILPPGTWASPILDPSNATPIGSFQASVQMAPTGEVQLDLRVQRDACMGICPPLVLQNAAVLASVGGLPSGVAVAQFSQAELAAGESAQAVVTVPGDPLDAGLSIQSALFGSLWGPDAGTDGGSTLRDGGVTGTDAGAPD